jgi:serine-type D-Ala-D-Ala carboxypeptidase (penicillin-binding protein 5/6)
MTRSTLLTRPDPDDREPPEPASQPGPARHRRRRAGRAVIVVGVAGLAVAGLVAALLVRSAHDDDSRRHYLGSNGWPSSGQAAYAVGTGPIEAGPGQRPAPIASVAKVMTAYLVLRHDPLAAGASGFRLRITAADVADYQRRVRQDQSVTRVRAGEVLTERQALYALLLPSANNVAALLARHVGGSEAGFVALMNQTARALGMRHTRYTDPSGFEASTRSTAADEIMLARAAMRVPVFAAIVGTRTYVLPVAGVVHNTDTLLGHDGFVGIKTGSMDASGGCFMFQVQRHIQGQLITITGVVLGQPGHDLVDAGQYAAKQLAAHLTGI